jgi:hypothetical protein
LHARIANVLTEHFPETASGLPEVLAQHYSSAGLIEQAVAAWHRAGERAVSRSALKEAIAHFQHGLNAIRELAEGRKRQNPELDLRMSLAGVLTAPKGFAAPEVHEQFALARNLAEQLGDEEQLIRVMLGPWLRSFTKSEHYLSLATAREMISFAERHGSALSKLVAHLCMGITACQLGDLTSSREYLEQSLRALDDPHLAQTVLQ